MKIKDYPPPIRDALILALFALIIGAALTLVQRGTADAISDNEHRALRQTLQAVLPAGDYNNDPLDSQRNLVDGSDNHRTVYRAYNRNRPVAVAITANAPDGYAGQIDLLVGVDYEGTVTGVRVLSHQETPGLGDKIDIAKSQWIIDFDGQSLAQTRNWKVKKDGGDFDQFTGATITPRAVVSAVRRTLEWYAKNRQQIFEQ